MSTGRNQNTISVDSIPHQNSDHANLTATICCNLVFSSNQTSTNLRLSEGCIKVALDSGAGHDFRELPSVVTWLSSPTTTKSRIEYSCGQSVLETGLHYFEILIESEFGSSIIPLVGVIEADAAPSSSERFSGLCLSALTCEKTQRRLMGCNSLGPLDVHESKELDAPPSDGVMVSGFFVQSCSSLTCNIMNSNTLLCFSAERGYWSISRSGFRAMQTSLFYSNWPGNLLIYCICSHTS
jgi:hypothetical protein